MNTSRGLLKKRQRRRRDSFSLTVIYKQIKLLETHTEEEGFGNISLARDVMTKGLITIKFDHNLSDACKLILENNVSGLVVLDGNESIAGIINKLISSRLWHF